MNSKMKSETIVQFIELYKNKEVLWNMSSSLYRRNDLKAKAYESIAQEMCISVEDVKKKIKALRNTYTAERNKVEKSKKSGCGTESIHKPTLFWYEDMTFLNTSLVQRKTTDNSEKESSKSIDESASDAVFNLKNSSLLQSLSSEASGSSAKTSLKRKCPEEPPSKFDSALNKLLELNQKNNNVYEGFAENIGIQLSGFPEDEAYILMADIQTMVSKRKIQITRNARISSRASTPISEPINLTGPQDESYNEEYLEAESDAEV